MAERPGASWSTESRLPAGLHYPSLLNTQRGWRPVLGLGLALSGYVVVTAAVSLLVLRLSYLIRQPGTSLGSYRGAAMRYEDPVGLLAQGLGIAALLVVCVMLMRGLHHRPAGWLASVQGRIRWGYLVRCLLVAAIVLYGATAVSVIATGDTVVWQPQPGFVAVLLIVAVVTPLQSAAEEVLFRGYLMQTLGSFFPTPWVGVVLSSALFAALHGSQNLPLFINRLGFGLLAAVLVMVTGGLEAGIAAHVVNNVGAYLLAALTTSIADLRAVRALTWSESLADVAAFAIVALIAILLARRMRLPAVTAPEPEKRRR